MSDVLMGGVVINELFVDLNGAPRFNTVRNGTADAIDECIDLFNTTATAFDTPPTDCFGFSASAVQSGTGQNLGNDIDGYSIQRRGDDPLIGCRRA